MGFEPQHRERAQPPLFDRCDCLGRKAEAIGAARLHLAEDDRRTAPYDEIELALADAPVAGEHLEPAVAVPRGGRVLAGIADVTSRVRATRGRQRSTPRQSSLPA